MTSGSIWAVVPVKPFDLAKQRLADLLDVEERSAIARAMYEDVLDAILAAGRSMAGAMVVSSDPAVCRIARDNGCIAVVEEAPTGINSAVGLAVGRLDPEAGMVVIPADLPHLSAGILSRVVSFTAGPEALVIVPALRDGGTNILGCRPAGLLAPCFGADSFRRHFEAGVSAGLRPVVVDLDNVGRDIDCPDDLRYFETLQVNNRTDHFLRSRGIYQRVAGKIENGPGDRHLRVSPRSKGGSTEPSSCDRKPAGNLRTADTVF